MQINADYIRLLKYLLTKGYYILELPSGAIIYSPEQYQCGIITKDMFQAIKDVLGLNCQIHEKYTKWSLNY